ncbi:hypothetical protein [Bacteroides cellulosilyticus]|uniref:hypothetical protein n=1 Tax=Bacteroides cellulosilyticus TaxID=246787 RepID=UPI00101D1E90|nr:hypothetical protein [Bacteroides cellulosilyticus]
MNNQTLLESAQSLSSEDCAKLISALTELGDSLSEKIPSPRLEELLKETSYPDFGGNEPGSGQL